MGKNTSKPTLKQYMNKFNVHKKDQQLYITYLTEKRSNKQFILKEMIVNDRQSVKNLQTLLQKKKQLNHQHITILRQYYITQDQQFCSTISTILALYEFPFRTLLEERKDRFKSNILFTQTQLWSILASCILGLSYLYKNHIRHMSVRSSNIYVQQSGVIKISDPFAKPVQTNLELFQYTKSSQVAYLSPIQLKTFKSPQKIFSNYKSDIFSLGMVMLELALLESQQMIYQKFNINETLLKQQIQRIRFQYGEQFSKIISHMVQIEDIKRVDWNQLQNLVKKEAKVRNSHKNLKEEKNNKSFRNSYLANNNKFQQEKSKQFSHHKNTASSQALKTYQHHNNKEYQTPAQKLKMQQSVRFPLSPNQNIAKVFFSPNNHGMTNLSVRNQPNTYQNQNNELQQTSPKVILYKSNSNKFMNQQHILNSKRQLLQPMQISSKSIFLQKINLRNYSLKTKIDQNLVDIKIISRNQSSSPTTQTQSIKYQQYVSQLQQILPVNKQKIQKKNSNKNKKKYNRLKEDVMAMPKNNIYKNNKIQYVQEIYPRGARYQGYKLNNLRHGKGKFIYYDGGMYQGDWVNNSIEGEGKLFYPSGRMAYQGQWKNSNFDGYGKQYNQSPIYIQKVNYRDFNESNDNWKVYQGEFKNDLREGVGVLIMQNGERYEGQFYEDEIQGEGIWKGKQNLIIKGIWQNNILVKTL